MTYTTEMHKRKVLQYLKQPTARNGVRWPEKEVEAFILAWIQLKAEHGYFWPEWAAASEAAEAAEVFYADAVEAAWMYEELKD